jgi:hypothetical protein
VAYEKGETYHLILFAVIQYKLADPGGRAV